jgi:hypothetical protein
MVAVAVAVAGRLLHTQMVLVVTAAAVTAAVLGLLEINKQVSALLVLLTGAVAAAAVTKIAVALVAQVS